MGIEQAQSSRAGAHTRPQKPALSIRARLLVLALLTVTPLMLDRIRLHETLRAERIEAAHKDVMALVRQGADAQREVVIAVRSIIQVVARARTSLGPAGESCNRFLIETAAGAPWITSLAVVGLNGRIVCATAPQVVGLDMSDRPYFQEALRSGKFVLSDYLVSRHNGGTGIVAAIPIEGDSATAGVITAGIDLQWMGRVAAAAARRPGSLTMIVDHAGAVIAAHPSPEKWLGRKLSSEPRLDELLRRESGIVTLASADGVRRIFGFLRLPGLDARLAVGLDEAAVLGEVEREMRLAYVQLALVCCFVLLGVWWGGDRLVVRPLHQLARAAARIGRGNLERQSSGKAWAAEFAPLAAALDEMAHRLAEREQELRVANRHLEELTRIDSLSGLANRRAFDARLEAEWHIATAQQERMALMMIDVDHFKRFNDTYGHVEGDACLRAVGETLARAAADRAVLVARYGGEEFAVLVRNADTDAMVALGERLRAAIEDLDIAHVGSPCGRVTASIGVAALTPAPGQGAEILVEAADAALYGAKHRGRNAVVAHGAVELLATG
jgi:diguanylate cyclase (GGDEF)-like protein